MKVLSERSGMVGIRFLRLFARRTESGPKLNSKANVVAIMLTVEQMIVW